MTDRSDKTRGKGPRTNPVANATSKEFAQRLTASGLMTAEEAKDALSALSQGPKDAVSLARELVARKTLTPYQAQMLYRGQTKGLVLGDYVILEKLGQGGMGLVFKARHRLMKRTVALKVLPTAMIKSPDSVARFHREVVAAARLSHLQHRHGSRRPAG